MLQKLEKKKKIRENKIRDKRKEICNMVPYLVEQVRHLSQNEGLSDEEIAKQLGCSRATVNRTRKNHNIPLANLENRKDKSYTCVACNETIVIARKERKKRYCPECRKKLNIGKYKKKAE